MISFLEVIQRLNFGQELVTSLRTVLTHIYKYLVNQYKIYIPYKKRTKREPGSILLIILA